MIAVEEIAEADWPATSAAFADLGYEQCLGYARAAAAAVGAQNRFVLLRRAGAPVAAACLRIRALPVLGRGIAHLAGGPLVSPDGAAPDTASLVDILAVLRRRTVTEDGHILRLRPSALGGPEAHVWATAAAGAGFAPTGRIRPYRSFALDLRQSEDDRFAGLHPKWRARLRKALKAGLTLEAGHDAGHLARFEALLAAVSEAKGFAPPRSPAFFAGLDGEDFRHDILIASREGKDLGGILIGTAGPSAVYLLGATAEAGRSLNAGYFLSWEGMRLAASRGARWYDLGGADKAVNPAIHEFKERTGGLAIVAEGFEASPGGALARGIAGLEHLHGRLRGRG